MAAMGVSVYALTMMMVIMGAAAQAPSPSVDCETAVFTLTDCLTFVTGGAKAPSATCCSELASIVSSSPQCLCLLFNTTFTDPLGVNITLAQQLPPLCKVQTPPTSLCTLLGVPVPGPVSSGMAPSHAKAPSSAKAPASAMTPTKASAPVAPTPMSSSPTSSPTPAMSPPASSPSSTTAMGPASSSPTTNATNTTSAPNSAPSITSKNAAVAAYLFFFASIFLS